MEALAHPLLGAAANVVARWQGREVFHAGAFALDGHGLCIVGANQAGKSTLLSAIGERGHPIIADDLTFTDGHQLFAGPRILDLRSARGTRAPLRPVRDGRLRMTLGRVPSCLPLGGWVLLEWGSSVSLEPIAPSELLRALVDGRSLRRLPSDPRTFLMLAGRPAWRLRRPRDLAHHEAGVELLLAAVGA